MYHSLLAWWQFGTWRLSGEEHAATSGKTATNAEATSRFSFGGLSVFVFDVVVLVPWSDKLVVISVVAVGDQVLLFCYL